MQSVLILLGPQGDRFGRKQFIVGGLALCSLALVFIAIVGSFLSSPDAIKVLIGIGASLLGLGTAAMYSNNLAAVSDYAAPEWRSSAMGTYRFWRDSGYIVGPLLSGFLADNIGIGATICLVAMYVGGVAVLVHHFFRDFNIGKVGPFVSSERI
eukprot:SAG31_NODE_2857_length_4991_cov_51.196443_5_plen_154_part_00